MKIKTILLSATIFAFVGCGGTDTAPELGGNPQGAMGNYNNTFGSQNIAGIWSVYGVKTGADGRAYVINRSQPSEKFELDGYGKLYNIPIAGTQKQQIATYDLISDQELKIFTQSGVVVAQYVGADKQDNNCFYTKSTFQNQAINELWCKKSDTAYQDGGVEYGGSEPDIQGYVEFKDFLFPYDTISTGIRIAEDIHVYEDGVQGVRYLGSYEKEFRKFISNNTTQITENHDSRKYRTYEIHATQISSFDNNDINDGEYPLQVSAGDTLSSFVDSGVELACRVENITKGIDLSYLLPSSIIQNFEKNSVNHYYPQSNSFTYTNKTIHVHCDASNGYTLDEYFVDAWGSVLTISKSDSGTSRYEILDKLSIRH